MTTVIVIILSVAIAVGTFLFTKNNPNKVKAIDATVKNDAAKVEADIKAEVAKVEAPKATTVSVAAPTTAVVK